MKKITSVAIAVLALGFTLEASAAGSSYYNSSVTAQGWTLEANPAANPALAPGRTSGLFTWSGNPDLDGIAGLAADGAGAQYHYVLSSFGVGDSTAISGADHAQVDPHYPGVGNTFYGVGQASWCQTGSCSGFGTAPSIGHTSTAQLLLLHLTDPAKVTFSLANAAADGAKWGPNEDQQGMLGGDLVPGFTLFQGAKMDGVGILNHTYRNGFSGFTESAWPNLPLVGYSYNPTIAS